MRISASRIDCYLQCPLKYKFRYIDQIEPDAIQPGLAFGSSVHRSIAHFYQRLMAGEILSIEQLHTAFQLDWEVAQTVPIAWNGQAPDEMEKQGCDMLTAYMAATPDPLPPLAVEKEINVPLVNLNTGEICKDVSLFGYIDRIERGNAPVELKTAARSWSQMQAEQYLQMTANSYALAYEALADAVDGLFEVIVKNKAPRIQHLVTRRTVHDFDRWFRTVVQIIESIVDERFYPNPGFLCPSCDYATECSSW